MARGTTLVRLLDNLRAEAGLSLNPAHNNQARDVQINTLQRTQERLWDDFSWPHLRVQRQVPVSAGQRYYDPPEDLDISRLESIELFRDGTWAPLAPGIEGCHLAAWNSDLDERSWPPRRWTIHDDQDIEIWPIADINCDPTTMDGTLKFTGIRNLRPLVADSDRADLDDRLIVMFAAAEMLARSKSSDAQVKLDMANRIYARIRGGLMPRRRFRMFGVGETPRPRRMIAHYRPASN